MLTFIQERSHILGNILVYNRGCGQRQRRQANPVSLTDRFLVTINLPLQGDTAGVAVQPYQPVKDLLSVLWHKVWLARKLILLRETILEEFSPIRIGVRT